MMPAARTSRPQLRVTPRCRHFGDCGGCSLQDVAYDQQLIRKRERLQRLLDSALGSGAPVVQPMAASPALNDGTPWGFRQKVSFVFGPGPTGRGLVMGHFARDSNRIVPIEECPVHSARGNDLAFALRESLARAGMTAAGPRLDGIARHVVIRTTADARQAVVMLVVTRNDKRLRAPVRAMLAKPGAPTGFLVNVHDRPGPYMIGRDTIVVAGSGTVRETTIGPAFLVSPAAFFQTNVDGAVRLVDEVLAAVPDRPVRRILDLYSGSGLFGLTLAARGHTVTMVEENRQAMADAEQNRRVNHVPSSKLRLVCSRVEDTLMESGRMTNAVGPDEPRGRRRVDGPDVVILDPPRGGCSPGVIEGVFRRLEPPLAVYVSCDPEALARDLRDIVAAGYRVTRVQPVDMFPHTDHIETVAVLEHPA
jgi:23S rRNA (uracil1939-C5)-methyltransferase